MKEVVSEFKEDNVPLLGAAQAFYYLLSIVPMLMLILSILPYLNIDPERAINIASSVLPPETTAIFADTIISVITTPSGGFLTFSIIAAFWSASLGVNAFIKATNEAYNVSEARSFIKGRALSFGLTLAIMAAIIIALILPIFGDNLYAFVEPILHLPEQAESVLHFLRWFISVVVMILVLAALYKWAPNLKISYRYVWPGAIAATALWQLISWGFSLYVSNFDNFSATYGSLGGIIILMLWFFLTGIILVIGAEINAIYYRRNHYSRKLGS
nr:YihY/virulence factor BrkB family protein [Salsuginibacillus kocurii]